MTEQAYKGDRSRARYQVLTPEGLPIGPQAYFRSERTARRARTLFVERFRAQGWYFGVGRRLSLSQLHAECTIVRL